MAMLFSVPPWPAKTEAALPNRVFAHNTRRSGLGEREPHPPMCQENAK